MVEWVSTANREKNESEIKKSESIVSIKTPCQLTLMYMYSIYDGFIV